MLDELRKIPLFADLSEEDLQQLYQMAETVSIPSGQLVLREGDQGDSVFVVLDGELEVTKRQGSHDVLLALYKPCWSRRQGLPRCVHCKKAVCW